MAGASIQQMADRVAQLMEERLRMRGKGLSDKLRRGGRVLPRKVRLAAEALAQAATMAQNPKLLLQIDHATVAEAYDICLTHLNTVNRNERRKTVALNVLASIAFSLLLLAALLAGFAYWRGLV